jgi:antitoxin (DNA-binding transcriptional repressor) of toxin-antitoxin stability system
VKRGRSVTISERGKVIARVVPVERSTDIHERLAEMERDGVLVRRPCRKNGVRPLARRPGALRRFLESRG